MTDLYDFVVKDINGHDVPLSDYRGKVLLIANTASKCGFTSQYKGLETLYHDLRGRGLEVLAFPCNQFGNQEPGDAGQIASFCELNYGVTFPLFAKVDVNGPAASPLFAWLKKQAPGFFFTEGVKWNFTKFLVNRDGSKVERFAPTTKPEAIKSEIEKLL